MEVMRVMKVALLLQMSKVITGLISFLISGCAIHYTDNDGTDSYFGLVSVSAEYSSCVITTTSHSFGLTLDTTAESGGINLGYRVMSKSYVRENELVEIEERGGINVHSMETLSECIKN